MCVVVGCIHTVNMCLSIYYHVATDALQFIESNLSFIQVIYMCRLDKALRGATEMTEEMMVLTYEVGLCSR